MRKPLLLLAALSTAAAAVASECEAVPGNRKAWQAEPVVTGKLRGVDAVFIGTVTGTGEGQNLCTATISPTEVFKGGPGNEVTATQFDNRYEGSNDNKCTDGWVQQGGSYLFYLTSMVNRQGMVNWLFSFCSLDSHAPVKSVRKEIAILRKLSGK